MSANVEGLVREGMNAIKAGRKDEGKAMLLRAVELDQYNAEAWLWLSGTMESLDDQRTCLENVLAVDPNNQRAKQGLEYLAKQKPKPPTSPLSPASSPLISRATSTSVEWGAPEPETSAAPTWTPPPAAKEPTEADLDAWVTNLNLPGAVTVKPSGNSPFTDFNLDDDIAGGPFGAAVEVPAAPPPAAAPPQRITAPPPKTPAAPPPAPRASAPVRSPVPTDTPSFAFDEDLEAAANQFIQSNTQQLQPSTSILYDADKDQDGKFLEEEEGLLFAQIPGEIKPTRLPGTRERAPLVLVLATVLLVIVNVGAAALLAIGLLSA